jgi:hypothetical protein
VAALHRHVDRVGDVIGVSRQSRRIDEARHHRYRGAGVVRRHLSRDDLLRPTVEQEYVVQFAPGYRDWGDCLQDSERAVLVESPDARTRAA